MIYGPRAKSVGHKSTAKKEDRENDVSKIFSISVRFVRRTGKERKLV